MGSSKAKAGAIPVSKRALVQRINRRLAHDRRRIEANRGERAQTEWGQFTLIEGNTIVDWFRDLEELAERLGRKLGVLAAYEEVRDD